jgi:hypothetical protein
MNPSESTILLVPKPDLRESVLQQMRDAWSRTPQLRLTPVEIQQRWHLEPSTCFELLNVLIDLQVITRSEDGSYHTPPTG